MDTYFNILTETLDLEYSIQMMGCWALLTLLVAAPSCPEHCSWSEELSNVKPLTKEQIFNELLPPIRNTKMQRQQTYFIYIFVLVNKVFDKYILWMLESIGIVMISRGVKTLWVLGRAARLSPYIGHHSSSPSPVSPRPLPQEQLSHIVFQPT